MLIGDKYQIKSDPLQYIVEEKKVNRKTREEYWNTIGYFSNLPSAFNFLVNLKVKETDLSELETVIDKIEEVYRDIKQALDGRNA